MSTKPITTQLQQQINSEIAALPRPLADSFWAIASADLLNGRLGEYANFTEFSAPQLATALAPERISRTAASWDTPANWQLPRLPLGILFEKMLDVFFTLPGSPFERLLKNYQIRNSASTLGELDFVLQHPDGHLLHVETAIKFYLLRRKCSSAEHWHNWLGPNSSDRLDIKLHRMMDHQLPMAVRYQQWLPDHCTRNRLNSLYLLKGVFFHHCSDQRTLPRQANPAASTGIWMHLSEWLQRVSNHDEQWLPLQKHQWLMATLEGYLQQTECFPEVSEIRNIVQTSQASCLPKLFLNCSTHRGVPREQLIMVVPDYWPETKSPPFSK